MFAERCISKYPYANALWVKEQLSLCVYHMSVPRYVTAQAHFVCWLIQIDPLPLMYLLLLLLRRYHSPDRAIAFWVSCLQDSVSLALFSQPVWQVTRWHTLVTPSSHLFRGFLILLLWIVGYRDFFGIQCSSIWIICPANWIYWFYIPCAKVHVQLSLQWPSSYCVPIHYLMLVMRFINNISTGEVSLMPIPQPGGPEYPFLSARPCQ